jgi:hypothetical protein
MVEIFVMKPNWKDIQNYASRFIPRQAMSGDLSKIRLFSSKSIVAKQSRKVLTSWSALLLSNEPLASAQE